MREEKNEKEQIKYLANVK